MDDLIFEKSTCEKYVLRKKGSWWAIFTIDEQGMLNVQSDYGSYHYHWRSIGEVTFKEFLCDLDDSYLRGKFGGMPNHFNGRETEKALRDLIDVFRKEGSLSALEAGDCRKEIGSLDYYDQNSFGQSFMATEHLSKHFPDLSTIPVQMDYDPALQGFLKYIWPEFVRVLKEEILVEEIANG